VRIALAGQVHLTVGETVALREREWGARQRYRGACWSWVG
jgi:hypothetical protein